MKRKWGLGSWCVGGGLATFFSGGQVVAEIVCLSDMGLRVFYRGKLLREKPYATIGNAKLAAERALRKERSQ